MEDDSSVDVVVVGAGAAGVSVAGDLQRLGLRVVVLERGDRPGVAWAGRYERLHLHTDRRLSHVLGSRIRRPRTTFVPARAFAAHVDEAARHLHLDVRCGVTVERVSATERGCVVEATGITLHPRAVVVATGVNDIPVEPNLPGRDRFRGAVLHSSAYRSGAPFAGQRVVVVGAGNTGTELAQDLVEHGAAAVTVSMRSIPRFMPRRLGPISSHLAAVVLTRVIGARGLAFVTRLLGRLRSRRLTALGLAPASQPAHGIPTLDHGFIARVAAGDVQLAGSAAAFEPDGLRVADGRLIACDAVVLATGFRPGVAEFLDPDLGPAPGTPDFDASRDGGPVWFAGFEVTPVGQLVLARRDARRVAASVHHHLSRQGLPRPT